MNRGVTCVLFGSLKINLEAALWMNCRGLIESIAIVKSGQNKSLNKELCCMFPEKGPDLLNII